MANRDGYPVRIRDIGRVEDSFEEPRSLARLDGRNAVSLIVQKQSGTNTVAVVENVRQRFEKLRELLPPDIETFVVKDQSRFIVKSIEEMNFHLVVAGILVAITILVFIQDWRTTIIASLAIPASIVTTFAFMYWTGYTLNNMTMLGLILAIGIVIDDAVVINENIFRHMEEDGVSALEAASSATKEISLAVSATTLSLLVIFIPIVFMGGRIGRFFSSFGATVAFAILVSWFVSFTMTPMLCSRFLKRKGDRSHSKDSLVWRSIDGLYGWVLRWSLHHRWVIVLTTVCLFVATVFLFKIVGFDFIPRDDQSEFEVAMTLPEGYTLAQADKLFAEIEGRIAQLKGVTNVFTTIGDTTGRVSRGQGDVTKGTIYARLTDLEHAHVQVVRLAILVQRDPQSPRGGSSLLFAIRRAVRRPGTHDRLHGPADGGPGFRRRFRSRLPTGDGGSEFERPGPETVAGLLRTRRGLDEAASRLRRYRYEPVVAEARASREDRPRAGFRSGCFRPDHCFHAERPGRWRAGDEVQGNR